MPVMTFDVNHMTALQEVVNGTLIAPGVVTLQGARLKRIDTTIPDNTTYSRGAPLVTSAEFTTQAVAMNALSEIFGVRAEGRYEGPRGEQLRRGIRDSVSVQISVDGGNTFLTYNNGWVAAAPGGLYTNLDVFDERCALFQPGTTLLNPRSLQFRVRLTPYTAPNGVVYNPILTGITAYLEWESNPYLDLFGTVKELLEEDFRIPVVRQHTVQASEVAANAIPLQTNYTVDAAQPITVHNLTDDPNKNADLFQAYDAQTNTITLIPASDIAVTDIVEINFRGSAPVFVVRPDEMAVTTNIPSVVATVGPASIPRGRSAGREVSYKLGTDTFLARYRNTPVLRGATLRVEVYARSAREAVAGIQSLERILTRGLQSIATGETFAINLTNPGVMVDFGDQSYYSGNVEFNVQYFDHVESYEEVVVAQTIISQYGNFSKTFSTATIDETGVVNEIL